MPVFMLDKPLDLDNRSKAKLLALARQSIAHFLETGERAVPSMDSDPVLSQRMGVFVSLHQGDDLRGCVGITEPVLSLRYAVVESAFNAAFCDSRFYPLTEKELSKVEIEISCLTPPRPVEGFSTIELGRHGIVLQRGTAKGVFLPQVAVQEGWDLPTTLSHLAVKAGLSPDAWKKGCEISVFETIVFSEKDIA